MVFKKEGKSNFKENGESYGESLYCHKVFDSKTFEEQMDILGLRKTIDQLATENEVRWYGHALRRDDDSVLRVALNFEVSGKKTTDEDLDEGSGGGDREDCFEEGRCPESSKVERWSVSNHRRNRVNLAISAKGTAPDNI